MTLGKRDLGVTDILSKNPLQKTSLQLSTAKSMIHCYTRHKTRQLDCEEQVFRK